MKRFLTFCLALCLALSASACGNLPELERERRRKSVLLEQPSDPQPSEDDHPALPPEAQPVEPEHSEYYLPGYSAEDVFGCFSEVALDIEEKADPDSIANRCVKKWASEIRYQAVGDYTEEDLITLRDFWDQLSQVDGMPPIREAGSDEDVNFTITFCDLDAFLDACPNADEYTQGYVWIWWYDDNLEVIRAEIYIRSDINQDYRNRVIRHEVYQGLGMLQDASREDSIIYLDTLQADGMSALDLLIVTLLYHEDIKLGMNGEECREVIEKLYY